MIARAAQEHRQAAMQQPRIDHVEQAGIFEREEAGERP